jgi:hypothetical protein
MSDLITEVQKQVARLRNMITETKTLFPNSNINFIMYEIYINEAERAIREQDTVVLIRILQELKEME